MRGSIYSIKIRRDKSSIHGYGTVAVDDIKKGEIIFVKNGEIIPNEDKYSEHVIDCYWPIGDGFVLGTRFAENSDDVKLFINHSCNPNCGLQGINTGVALRDIEKGEEITFDYAMLDNEEYEFECHCGSDLCRKRVTGFDWKISELQERYKGYFVDYLQEIIDKTDASSN